MLENFHEYKRFRGGREDFEDDARPGRPNTSITEENVVFFITNFYHQAVPSIKSTIYKFHAISVRRSGENDLNFGETIRGFCTIFQTQTDTQRTTFFKYK